MRCSATPVGNSEFDELLGRFAPFEAMPRVAVALSGGRDSTALLVLAKSWAQNRNGDVLALIVDHGLRPESRTEARHVEKWCRQFGVTPHLLTWHGPKPVSAIEETARHERMRLLSQKCNELGVLHLLVAHHRDDQFETICMRRQSGSGTVGLAGMSGCVEHSAFRILRPLLDVPGERLGATLVSQGFGWVEDPSNRDTRFARARMRVTVRDPGIIDHAPAVQRVAWERKLSGVIARIVTQDEFGVARVHRNRWRCHGADLRAGVLARVALTTGGGTYAPSSRKLSELDALMCGTDQINTTLGRCLWRGNDVVTVMRERRHLPDCKFSDGEHLWDGRFRMTLPRGSWRVCALTRDVVKENGIEINLPESVLSTLPAVFRSDRLVAIPSVLVATDRSSASVNVRFAPRHLLVPPLFRAMISSPLCDTHCSPCSDPARTRRQC